MYIFVYICRKFMKYLSIYILVCTVRLYVVLVGNMTDKLLPVRDLSRIRTRHP